MQSGSARRGEWLPSGRAVRKKEVRVTVRPVRTLTGADEDWRKLVGVVVGDRIMGETCEHRLSPAAIERFLAFHADNDRQQVTAAAQQFTAWWPEQVLKIALLLHLDTPYLKVPQEVGPATLESALVIMKRLGAAQLRLAELVAVPTPPAGLEIEVELMVAKVRLYGLLKNRIITWSRCACPDKKAHRWLKRGSDPAAR